MMHLLLLFIVINIKPLNVSEVVALLSHQLHIMVFSAFKLCTLV